MFTINIHKSLAYPATGNVSVYLKLYVRVVKYRERPHAHVINAMTEEVCCYNIVNQKDASENGGFFEELAVKN